MTSGGEILARLFRAVVVLASLAGLVSAPAKVAYPSAFDASIYASSLPLNGSLATSNSPPRVAEPLPSSNRPAGRPVGRPVHHPVPNLDENPPPLAAAPSSLSVAPSGNRAEQLTTTAASWTAIGPMPIVDERCCGSTPGTNVGMASGRVTSLAVDPTNASVVYAGAAGGGVWKSINGGTTWTPLTDSQASLAIGALGISANGQVIYAGTGEDNGSDSQYGQGILVSTNGGSSWTLTGQGVFAGRHIGSIAVDRSNSSHALAATDVGLYTTNNTGTTWTQNTQILTQITAIGPATGGIFQVVQAPDNSLQFWAVAGDRCQTEFGDILVSGDSGNTWSQSLDVYFASGGTAAASRIALDVGSGGTVYAALSDCNANGLALFKLSSSVWARIDAGLGLDYFNLTGGKTGQGDYDNVVAVDPTSNNHVVFGGVTIVASSDGGSTYTDIGNVYGEAAAPGGFIHPDFHAIAFTGANSFYVGNDGGVWKTTDLGGSGQSSDWVNLNATLNTVQFFRGISPDLTHLLGGAQDNGSLGNLPGSASLPGWQGYHGGDGGFTAVNASGGATTVYAEYPHLVIERGSWTLDSSDQYSPYDSFQAAAPCISGSEPACGDPSGFTAPFRMDPTNPQRLIAGTNKVYQSTSGGAPGSWTAISSDLTTGTTVFASGDFLSAITMGQKAGQTGIIFTGSNGGAVYVTTNGGTSWTSITGNLPTISSSSYVFPNPWISSIAFNPANPQEAWVTIGGVGVQHVWHTLNAGAPSGTTWSALDGAGASGLPNEIVSAVVEDPTSANTIYIGTYYGVLVCTSCGGSSPNPSWSRLGSGLPNVDVNDLTVTTDGSTLVAWTHGRGAWSYPLGTTATTTTTTRPTTTTTRPPTTTTTTTTTQLPTTTTTTTASTTSTTRASTTTTTASTTTTTLAVVPCGDVNGDGIVNIGDALVVAQFDVGLRQCSQLKHPEVCDVNRDGACNIGDALRMAQCDVGLVSCQFTCGAFRCP